MRLKMWWIIGFFVVGILSFILVVLVEEGNCNVIVEGIRWNKGMI